MKTRALENILFSGNYNIKYNKYKTKPSTSRNNRSCFLIWHAWLSTTNYRAHQSQKSNYLRRQNVYRNQLRYDTDDEIIRAGYGNNDAYAQDS